MTILEKMRSCLWKLELGFQTLARYIFWAQVTQMQFLGLRPQGHEIFWNLIILLHSYNDSGENEVLLVKIGARITDLWLVHFLTYTSFGPKLLVFRPQMQNVTALGSKNFLMSSFIKFCMKCKPLFSNFGSFLTKLWVFIPRKLQNR